MESIANDFPSLMFGDTSYHGSQSPALYINAENNDVERGIINTGELVYLPVSTFKH